MRLCTPALVLALWAGTLAAAEAPAETAPPPAVEAPPAAGAGHADASYFMGFQMGRLLVQRNQEAGDIIGHATPEDFLAGLKDGAGGANPARDHTQANAVIEAFVQSLEAKLEAERAANLAAGEAHIAALQGKEGVTVLPSGMAYEVITEGAGPKPTASDTVRVLYHGTLLDGRVFDSTANRGDEPAEFPLSGVIPGWTAGIQLMPVGSKYRFHIPAPLAYRDQRRGIIAPNSLLIFDVELLAIVGK